MIDFGCGSGILGIAAALLGARKVFAVDNDPQALLATRDNAERNAISASQIDCLLPCDLPEDLDGEFMLANILAAPLIQLAPQLSAMTQAGGQICLSGILATQIDAVVCPVQGALSIRATHYLVGVGPIRSKKNTFLGQRPEPLSTPNID